MIKIQKLPVVLGATQVATAGDYGLLGVLTTQDWVLVSTTNTLTTISNAIKESDFIVIPDSSLLTGEL